MAPHPDSRQLYSTQVPYGPNLYSLGRIGGVSGPQTEKRDLAPQMKEAVVMLMVILASAASQALC